MLIAFLLSLLALTANGLSDDQHGSRRTKQLDLQDIQAPEELTTAPAVSDNNQNIINGYLPPASPSSFPPNIITSQSQQTFDFKSANSLKEESDLCKPPFDSCNSKISSSSHSKIPQPSRDLMPPFNDLELQTALPTDNALERETKITATKKELITATEKIITKATEQVTTRITPNTKPFPKAEATNELRSYLPPQPEFSAAAQTNVAVVQPANDQEHHHHDHHHHGHHHDENFNICDDAFHAFLCAPLKARKRITGAFPENLRGQSSFINYQKLLPNPEREPAPSNTLQNAYLPPKRIPSPSNVIPTTRLPILTTKTKPVTTTTTTTTTTTPPSTPKFIPQPSNSNDRFYLPPLTDNKISAAPSNVPILKFAEIKLLTTARPEIISTTRTTSTPLKQTSVVSKAINPAPQIFNSLPSNENRAYLPPSPNPQPAASFISTSKNVSPVVSVFPPVSSTFVPLPASTFVPLPVSTFVPLPVSTFNSLPSESTFSAQKFYSSTVKPFTTQKPLPVASSVFVPTFKPIIQVSTPSPQPSTFFISQTPKNPIFTKKSNPKLAEQSTNEDRSYLPPDPNEPAAAQVSSAAVPAPQAKNPFHHGRDLCTDPFHSFLCVSAKPRKRITGQLPPGIRPDSSNIDESRLRPDPSNQDENRVHPDLPLQGASAQTVGYKYPKPENPLPTPAPTVIPSTGYSYPKPEKIFPLPSQTISSTIEPELRPNEARIVPGYQYPKPEKPFPTTTNPSSTGYTYPRPQKPFPLPTEQKEVRQKPKQKPQQPEIASATTQTKGYQYPKPDQSLKLPEKSSGYSYPKPTKRLELPTESKGKASLPQTNPSLEPLAALGSADFIPVNKLNFKRSESKLVAGLRRFGERQRKRERKQGE